jgi:hypothetical protein
MIFNVLLISPAIWFIVGPGPTQAPLNSERNVHASSA